MIHVVNMAYQGIESYNVTKLNIGAADANNGKDKAIADTYI